VALFLGPQVEFLPATDLVAPFDSVAAFSSSGPTSDGRFKPDLVAPGITVSASLTEDPG
jgi:hypothetical protein